MVPYDFRDRVVPKRHVLLLCFNDDDDDDVNEEEIIRVSSFD